MPVLQLKTSFNNVCFFFQISVKNVVCDTTKFGECGHFVDEKRNYNLPGNNNIIYGRNIIIIIRQTISHNDSTA